MEPTDHDRHFQGSIPRIYQQYFVPMLFEPYAGDLAARVAEHRPAHVLEIAAGTGVVTRHLANVLPASTHITATDLNQPMLDQAMALGTSRRVEWQQADAMRLPFPDASFDVVVCQFGVMFLPDKVKAFSEARRVLRAGGAYIFNVWDRIEENEFADVLIQALARRFPEDPPRFAVRVPHGYFDQNIIAGDLSRAGFDQPAKFTTITKRSHAASADHAALAYCQGTPVRNEIEARDPSALDEATDFVAQAIATRFGAGEVDGRMQAFVVVVGR